MIAQTEPQPNNNNNKQNTRTIKIFSPGHPFDTFHVGHFH